MTLSKVDKLVAPTIKIFTLIGMLYTFYLWIDNTLVTKDDLIIALTEIRLGQIEESLSRYHRIGLPNLTDSEKHIYDKLILAEIANENQRNEILGL